VVIDVVDTLHRETLPDPPTLRCCDSRKGDCRASVPLIEVVKRIAFGFTSFRNYRIRILLYAGRPNWRLLATITPTSP